MKIYSNNNETRNNVNNAAALTVWDETTIAINAFELLACRSLLNKAAADAFSDYDREKAAALLSKLADAETFYKADEMTVWEETTIAINAFELLACRYLIERVMRRETLSDYDTEKAVAILYKLAEAEKAYKADDETSETRADGVKVFTHMTAERVMQEATRRAEAAVTVKGSTLPAYDMAIDCETFTRWINGDSMGADYIDPAAAFWFAVRDMGSESGTRDHCRERCAVLGDPLFVLKVEREADGLFTLLVRAAKGAPAVPVVAYVAADPMTADEPQADPITSEPMTDEPQAAPGIVARAITTAATAAALLLTFTTSAAPADELTADDFTAIYCNDTREALHHVAAVASELPQGVTLRHVTIKTL